MKSVNKKKKKKKLKKFRIKVLPLKYLLNKTYYVFEKHCLRSLKKKDAVCIEIQALLTTIDIIIILRCSSIVVIILSIK
jgi:hypothetical protein